MTAHTKRFVATLAAVWLAVTVAAAQAPAVHTGPRLAAPVDVEYGDAINRARDLLRPYLDQVPGIAVAVAKDGRIVWSEGLGCGEPRGFASAASPSR
jgi:CubicO group peptidase (beta-lactamase class C family)